MEINQDQPNMFSGLAQGQKNVEEYNTDHREEERITFVETMRTYNQEPKNDQLDQDNDALEECKEQQQVEEEDELNAHNTIFSSTSSAAVPHVIPQALQYPDEDKFNMADTTDNENCNTTVPLVVPRDHKYPVLHETPSISARKRATDERLARFFTNQRRRSIQSQPHHL